jgi:N-acetylneuraminate lyase
VGASQYLEAMKGVPNFKGIKFTDTNFFVFQQLQYLAPAVLGHPLNAVTGPDEMAVAGLAMGSDGAIGSTYNIQPKLNCRMHAAFAAGDVAGAIKLQEQLNAVIAKLIAACDCASRGTNIIAGLKAVYRARGIDVGPAREAAATALAPAAEADLLAFLEACEWDVE